MRESFNYEDFVLRIDQRGDGLRVRLVRSPFGPRDEAFSFPFEPQELAEFLNAVAWSTAEETPKDEDRGTRHLAASRKLPDSQTLNPKALGYELFQSLFTGSILQCFLRSLSHVESQPNTGLRIRLEFDPLSRSLLPLGALPWELLYRAESRDFLSRNVLTPVVRYIDVQHLQTAPPPLDEELRIVVVLSSPEGTPHLDQEGELGRIESAWGRQGGIRILKPERPTLSALRNLLRDTSPHALHFIGHGEFDPITGHGCLLFEDHNGGAHPVTGSLLAETLKIGHQIRLVFLNCCKGAFLPHLEGQDPYHGVASALLMGGVASVLAMQYPVSDHAAVIFSDAFYTALAAGDAIESAVSEGRLAVHQEHPDTWEWATPALYLSAPDGRLFRRSSHVVSTHSAGTGASDAPGLTSALSLLELKRFDAAIDAFEEILGRRPREADAHFYLALSRLRGGQPRTQKLDLIEAVEDDLRTAVELGGDQAQFLYLWALVKQDFYPWNGLRTPPPPVEELLAAASQAPVDRAKLRELLRILPTFRSPVRDSIEDALARD